MKIHVVQPGDSVFKIAQQYQVSMERLIIDNGLKKPERLVIGQTIVIMDPSIVHQVQKGETLYSIATQYRVTVNELFRNNPELGGETPIRAGQTLVVSYKTPKLRDIAVSGYAYPFVDKALLRKTLPYISFLIPFTYGVTPDGGLVNLDDAELIRLAREYGVSTLMHLSTLTEEGNFSNELASIVLNSREIQDVLIKNIVNNIETKGYDGLDIDFEFVFPEDRDLYTAFVYRLRETLNPLGYEVVTALAPKTSSDQQGLLYEGHDYKGIGMASDKVLLMTYEWGYTYGPPMAVAPISSVRAVLNYAVTQIRPDQIYLGVPNYGYDWTLPFVKGSSKAQSIANEYAVEIAWENGANISFDEVWKSPYFNYFDSEGKKHEVWFEDARSIEAKLLLIEEYGFFGAGYWNLMRPFPQNWMVLNSLYYIMGNP